MIDDPDWLGEKYVFNLAFFHAPFPCAAIYCFTPPSSDSSCGAAAGSSEPAVEEQLGALFDAMTLAMPEAVGETVEAPPRTAGPPARPEASPERSYQLTKAQHACLIWGLRAMEKLLPSASDRAQSEDGQAASAAALQGNNIRSGDEPEAAAATAACPKHDRSGRIASLISKFLVQSSLCLLQSSLPVAEAYLGLLCRCPGSAPHLNRILREHETRLRGGVHAAPPCSGDVGGGSPGQLVSWQLAATYLLILGHMVELYEVEAADFEHRLVKQAALSCNEDGDTGGCQDPDSPNEDRDPAADPGSAALSKPGDTALNPEKPLPVQDRRGYMHCEEQAQQFRVATRRFVDGLLSADSAPANRMPLLLRVLTGAMKVLAVDAPVGAGPITYPLQGQQAELLQMLALKALGRIMVLSGRLTLEHGHVVAGILAEVAASVGLKQQQRNGGRHPPATGEHEAGAAACGEQQLPAAGEHGAGAAAYGEEDHQRHPQQRGKPASGGLLLARSAVQLVERLVLADPNTSGWLLPELESMILALLPGAPMPLDVAAEADDGPTPLAEGSQASSAMMLDGGRLGLLITAVSSFSRILAADRLQLSSSTFNLLGQLLLSGLAQVSSSPLKGSHSMPTLILPRQAAPDFHNVWLSPLWLCHSQVQQASEQLVTQLMGGSVAAVGSAPKQQAVPARAGGGGAIGGSQPRGSAGAGALRPKVLLALYSGCDEGQRLALVERVLLPRQGPPIPPACLPAWATHP